MSESLSFDGTLSDAQLAWRDEVRKFIATEVDDQLLAEYSREHELGRGARVQISGGRPSRGIRRADPANQFHPVHPAHPEIRYHDIEMMFLKSFPSFLAAQRRFNSITMIHQNHLAGGEPV